MRSWVTMLVIVGCWLVAIPWLITDQPVELVPFLLAMIAGFTAGVACSKMIRRHTPGWWALAAFVIAAAVAAAPAASVGVWLPPIAALPSLLVGTTAFISFALLVAAALFVLSAMSVVTERTTRKRS